MRKFKFGIPLVGAVAIAFGLCGCADESHWGNSSNEKGSIRLNLTADTGIKSAKPVFRSDEGDAKEGDLSDFLELPTLDGFIIKLEKTSTGETSSWTFPEFKDYIEKNKFETGTYTLTAYYGEKGKQDFESPYIEGTTTFNVLADQDNEISLTAELMNSMIKINYTDAFKDYMKDYHTSIKTEGIVDPITYGTLETRPVFVEPKNANLTVHFTTKGKEITSDFNLGEFPPIAKTLHNITFDLSENASTGDATLEVKFDDTLEDEIIKVDLTEELLTSPAPTIECIGFENGQTLDLLEGGNDIETIKMQATASNKIVSGILTIESATYNPSWGNEIDLCKATADQQSSITSAGIVATNFGFNGKDTDLIAILDLTKFSQSTLPKGNHKISLIVTDEKGKVSDSAAVIFDNQEITLTKLDEPSIVYGSNRAELTLQYNGLDPMNDIHFFEEGNDNRIMQTSCIEQPGTRAAEMKTYLITLPLTNTVKSNVKITAYQKGTTHLNDFTIPVSIPEYRIEAYDAFSRYAYAKISTTDPSMIGAVTQNIVLKGNGADLTISEVDATNGVITISNLSQESSYLITSSLKGIDKWSTDDGTFTTEKELIIENGDFSETTETINRKDVEVGGKYTHSVGYQATANIVVSEPNGWASINAKTCWFDCPGAKNTWFQVPSTLEENGKVVLRNVAYDHNGTKPAAMPTGLGKDYWYNTNVPDFSTFAAGELFLGTYSFDGTEHRDDGKAFSSRPSSIAFDYSYEPVGDDKASIVIKVINSAGNVIASSEEILTGSNSQYSVKLPRYPFGEKASKLEICFRSSTTENPKDFVHIPQGDELSEGFGTWNFGNKNLGDNNYHAVAVGSKLTIDNVKAVYEDNPSPANAPKRKTNKRK